MAQPESDNTPGWQMDWTETFGLKKQTPAQQEQQLDASQPAWANPEALFAMFRGSPRPTPKPYMQAPSGASKGPSGGLNATIDSVFPKLIQAESRGKHTDASGNLTTSPVGARGITQVMPASGKDPGYGVAPLKNESEAEYLRFGKDLLTAYTKELGGDIRKGLAAYNWGIGKVQQAIAKHGDEWESKLPKETKNYLEKIVGSVIPSANAGGLPQQPNLGYGQRPDGSQKGEGFLGPLKAKDGSTMTEFSVGVNIGGTEMDIPTFVPTLTKAELNELLSGKDPSDAVVQKAVDHAKMRISEGKSPFAQKGEKFQKVK